MMEYINALRAGTRLEEYQIHAVLGQGGFGITYLADDIHLSKRVALKEYLPRDFATRGTGSNVVPNSSAAATDYRWGLDRFLDEARTLARFDHPHLNRVHRFFEANGTAYLVLEYIDGQTLSALLGKYLTVPDSHLQRIVHEVLDGLEEVHAAGYVHRDLKPSNIMLRGDGSAVVLDFGAARQAVGQRSRSVTSILTPGYAPIEQYDTKATDVGPWSDLYALGMVAYRCVSGLRDGDLPDAVARARAQRKGEQALPPAAEVGKGEYDARFLRAIDWALEVNEEDRPQSIAAWREALSDGQPAAATQPPISPPRPVPEPVVPEPSPAAAGGRRLSAGPALFFLLLGVVGAVGLYFGLDTGVETGKQTGSTQSASPLPAGEGRGAGLAEDPTAQLDPVDPEPPAPGVFADWERVKATNTAEAYSQFIARHPSSPLRKLAEQRLAEAD